MDAERIKNGLSNESRRRGHPIHGSYDPRGNQNRLRLAAPAIRQANKAGDCNQNEGAWFRHSSYFCDLESIDCDVAVELSCCERLCRGSARIESELHIISPFVDRCVAVVDGGLRNSVQSPNGALTCVVSNTVEVNRVLSIRLKAGNNKRQCFTGICSTDKRVVTAVGSIPCSFPCSGCR